MSKINLWPQKSLQNYIRDWGPAAIGARLRRLSERIDQDAIQIYSELGITFEQRWVGVLTVLSAYGPLTVSELASSLGISHASVSQTRESLKKAGLISSKTNPKDARSRNLQLTPAGRRIVAKLTPIWEALNEVGVELDAESGNAIETLERLDRALDRSSLYERAKKRLKNRELSKDC